MNEVVEKEVNLVLEYGSSGLKMVFFSLYGIHVMNLGIILGVVYFIFRKIFFIK